jgi:hypothetical protein
MLKEVIDRVDPLAELIDHHPWQHRITGWAHRPTRAITRPGIWRCLVVSS